VSSVVVFDNYDSFTWNLVHYIEEICNCSVPVVMNNDTDWEVLEKASLIVFSPGPGTPEKSGRLLECIRHFAHSKAFLGICLGHQALALHSGAELSLLDSVLHGKSDNLIVNGDQEMFPSSLSRQVGRYHSWVINPSSLSADWDISSFSTDGSIMSIKHKYKPWIGVQFHPESVLSPDGKALLKIWIQLLIKL